MVSNYCGIRLYEFMALLFKNETDVIGKCVDERVVECAKYMRTLLVKGRSTYVFQRENDEAHSVRASERTSGCDLPANNINFHS